MNLTRASFTLLSLPFLGSLSGCQSQQPSLLVQKFLGNRLQVLLDPEYVTSYRVAADPTDSETDESVAGFPLVAEGPRLNEKQTALVRDLVLSEGSYDFHSAKLGSQFQPLVGLGFTLREAKVDVLLSFSGTEWRFYFRDHYVIEDFDPVRADLVALVKELFPEDAEIQSLDAGN